MEEKILVKSENEKNYFITIGVAILVGGFLLSTIFGLDSIAYCMYPWSFSFYYVWPSIILIVAGFIYNGSEIVITDKRAYGTTLFKKRIDLPVDYFGCWYLSPQGHFYFNFFRTDFIRVY